MIFLHQNGDSDVDDFMMMKISSFETHFKVKSVSKNNVFNS